MQKLLNSYWGLCLQSTDGRDDHGRTSRHHPADVISKGIHLMSLAFGHASGAWLVDGIDFVLIESLLMDHSLVPTPFFWVQTFWLGSWFSFELSDWSAAKVLPLAVAFWAFLARWGGFPLTVGRPRSLEALATVCRCFMFSFLAICGMGPSHFGSVGHRWKPSRCSLARWYPIRPPMKIF